MLQMLGEIGLHSSPRAIQAHPRNRTSPKLFSKHFSIPISISAPKKRSTCFALPATAIRSPSASSSSSSAQNAEFEKFKASSTKGNLVPMFDRIFSDQMTPVTAYRALVKEDDRELPSFLFESVVNGNQQGRYSFVGAHPAKEVVAHGNEVVVLDHVHGTRTVQTLQDPMSVPEALSKQWRPASVEGLPNVFTGGWVGYTGYETVRYVFPTKIPFGSAPQDDRRLPDIHLALYNDVLVFDQATKLTYAITWVHLDDFSTVEAAYAHGRAALDALVKRVTTTDVSLPQGRVTLSTTERSAWSRQAISNMTRDAFLSAIAKVKEYIQSGDVFQLVLSHRFERRTYADPFEVYRSLRIVNPSPYMVYLQARGCILVASSPEILCRVDDQRVVTNRPLAGTRRRGETDAVDKALETELLADEKERAEHIMLVDLGRNDVGRVASSGTVKVDKLMEIERYSHVMHISSTVTGKLKPELDCWDALRAALPAGTISGAPKVRAMQIIDELEVNRRGPYGGGVGHISFTGSMDMALALRTMIVPTNGTDHMYQYRDDKAPRREWTFHIQAGAGVVADSKAEAEYEETVAKAAALGRAIDVAEQAFVTE